MTERFVEVDGVRMYCTEGGTGPTLLFIHGWGLDTRSWDAQLRFFEPRFRVIAYDWRGHGRSALTPPYRFAALARDLDGLLTALDVERPVLCGHSMGGTIVLEYATTYARPLAGLMLIDSNVPGTLMDTLVHLTRCYGASYSTDAVALAIGSRRTLELSAPIYGRTFWSRSWRAAHPEEYQAWRRHFADGNRLGMSRAYRASAGRTNPEPRLRTLSLPALVVQGTADGVFPLHMGRRIAADLRGSTLALIEGAGHMSMCEQPAQVNACIDAFLHRLMLGR